MCPFYHTGLLRANAGVANGDEEGQGVLGE